MSTAWPSPVGRSGRRSAPWAATNADPAPGPNRPPGGSHSRAAVVRPAVGERANAAAASAAEETPRRRVGEGRAGDRWTCAGAGVRSPERSMMVIGVALLVLGAALLV